MSQPIFRTKAAAALLDVSPNTLRSWQGRFGFPRPPRTDGGHRLYHLREIGQLRQALAVTSNNISTAIRLVKSGKLRLFTGELLVNLPWRCGSTGRTIHAQLHPEQPGGDPLIGVMDSPELAEAAVTAHNAGLRHEG